MKLKLLSSLILLSLSACAPVDDDIKSVNPDKPLTPLDPSTPVIKPTPVIPHVTYLATLTASGSALTGELSCNGSELTTGQFKIAQGQGFSCSFGSVALGDFTAPFPSEVPAGSTDAVPHAFELTSLQDNPVAKQNVAVVLQSINHCLGTPNICLEAFDSLDIADIYTTLDDQIAVDAFLKSKSEKATDEVGKAPSSHVDADVVPEVSENTSTDLNSGFVSAAAESSYEYKPSTEAQVLTTSTLTDDNGMPLVGIAFFSANATGITDHEGKFDYLWGDVLTFGIDTFEFGNIKGNQINYTLSDVSDNLVVKENINTLLQRYGEQTDGTLTMPQQVTQVFSQYPNVINELINLALPNGGKLAGTEFSLPNDFEAQFEHGLTQLIDNALTPARYGYAAEQLPIFFSSNNAGYVTQSLQAIFAGVSEFHVFNDHSSFYGASGFTRGMRALNLSNSAFPIMMARADINKNIPFGQPQAWTREGKPYIADAPAYVADVVMPKIPLVSKDNTTFGFPFVTAGEIGKGNVKGKVVFMGNSLYPSILSCPANYWANDALVINAETQTCTTSLSLTNDPRDDHGSMQTFFSNLFDWFSPNATSVATNITNATAAHSNWTAGRGYEFFIDKVFGFTDVTVLTKDGFSHISADTTPILILQAYETRVLGDGQTNRFIADTSKPKLSQDDVTALIAYINNGGNVLFMDAIDGQPNPEPIGRLADAAGISLGGSNVTSTSQANCGSSYYCHGNVTPNLHATSQYDMVVLERFPDHEGKPPFTIDKDGNTIWNKEEFMTRLEIPTYQTVKLNSEGKPELDSAGQPVIVTKFARIFVNGAEETAAAIAELEAAFVGTKACKNTYQYEINCIETRKGDGIVVRANYLRADFDRYQMNSDVVTSMVKSANLGSNVNALFEHELYYRTKGKQGARLSSVELNQAYDSLSIWLWNDNPYAFEPLASTDELGFETLVGFLNCYTNDQHGNGALCPADLKTTLIANNMIHGEGELANQLNPSYPLNYMEKPLTRIMLGRSFWDHDIKVDVGGYPGYSSGTPGPANVDIETAGKGVSFAAGNNQSTGLWAPQLQDVTVSGGVKASITVMMADDLTGKHQHETSLKRPPRMQQSFAYNGSSLTFKVPYGGLISITPLEQLSGENSIASFSFDGVELAAWWKNGAWIHTPASASAPIAEVDTGSFIYTTAINNVSTIDLAKFSAEMNRFAEAASDFYGRDETTTEGAHRRFTYPELKAFRHRFVNDKQISIGAAHSGYPVMNSSFNAAATNVPTSAKNDWLLWHEVGHNLAAAPFSLPGSTEVTNNILALYMQELSGRYDNAEIVPQMDRIKVDIQKSQHWLSQNNQHAWSHGNAGMRLVMFGQLKIWAESNFNLTEWYTSNDIQPNIYSDDQGWNMFKLMHRKARGDVQGDTNHGNGTNYCSSRDTGLNGADLLMVCSSYVSGYDLSEFFTTWGAGESATTNPNGTRTYTPSLTSAGTSKLAELKLNKPEFSPLQVSSLSNKH